MNTGAWTISQGASYEFDTIKGMTPALAQIDTGHYLCTYEGNGGKGWSVVLIPGLEAIQP